VATFLRVLIGVAAVAAIAATLSSAASGERAPAASGSDATGGHLASTPLAAPRRRARYTVRGIYDRDFSPSGFDHEAGLGFNFIDSNPYTDQMSRLARRGLKGFIWLGGYSNDSCTFRKTDDWVRSHVAAIARSRAVGAYFIDDEPDAVRCPTAPGQMRARSKLIKSIDRRPQRPTFLVIHRPEQLKLFAQTVNVIGLDRYPCKVHLNGCDYSIIHRQAAEAERLRIRYWGVIQAYGDDYYKLPTPAELHQQFVHWRRTKMTGYLVFAWRWPEDEPQSWLANHPELHAQLAKENAR
jgi:hypothetical protein